MACETRPDSALLPFSCPFPLACKPPDYSLVFSSHLLPEREEKDHARPLLTVLGKLTFIQWPMGTFLLRVSSLFGMSDCTYLFLFDAPSKLADVEVRCDRFLLGILGRNAPPNTV